MNHRIQSVILVTHLVLVPSLSLGPAPVGDVLILSFDLCNDAVEVQVTVVVHGQDDGGVGYLLLHLGQFLQKMEKMKLTVWYLGWKLCR